nr:nucleotidyl transferase AbiEii/AbiGii toxin family protein [Phenylobacterium aquaticum]
MTRFVLERLLWRLSISDYRQVFVLKGAMLFSLWTPTPYRATGDLDLLGLGNNDPDQVASLFREIMVIAADDGIVFKPDTLVATSARAEDEYSGVRLDFVAELAGARLPIHVDIGFGDAVTPGAQDIQYPSLLDLPAPNLRAYPPETVVAEKFQAMTALGMINTRMKDFFDLWAIANTFAFQGPVLAKAIANTFARRKTALPTAPPLALTAAFASARQTQWIAFLRRTEISIAPEPFPEIQAKIATLVMPPTLSVSKGEPFAARWQAGGAWTD